MPRGGLKIPLVDKQASYKNDGRTDFAIPQWAMFLSYATTIDEILEHGACDRHLKIIYPRSDEDPRAIKN